MSLAQPQESDLISRHPRKFHENKFVYPVLSRRSRGISVGINLNPDKVCNFDCIYCQVDRRSEAETKFVEMDRLLDEVEQTLELVESGRLYEDEKFQQVPAELRRLNDVAFSGDGEPTTYRNFDEIVCKVVDIKGRRGLHDVKMVLITNASMLHRPGVQRALEILDAHDGEIWAKLEAGTEEYYRKVERTTIPLRRILENISDAARVRPIVIQSLFMRIEGEPPPAEEFEAYYRRLEVILAGGGRIKLVQVYTVARPAAESYVQALTADELEQIAQRIRTQVGIPAECYPGAVH
jgi:wyosine [tRNA(Phe)-imidazoG37] synthetase (radical SAM superfamily)